MAGGGVLLALPPRPQRVDRGGTDVGHSGAAVMVDGDGKGVKWEKVYWVRCCEWNGDGGWNGWLLPTGACVSLEWLLD